MGVDCFGLYKVQKGFNGILQNAGVQVKRMYPCLKIWQRGEGGSGQGMPLTPRLGKSPRKELAMKKWYPEDRRFTIEVVQVGQQNKAEECRLGLEPGTPSNAPTEHRQDFARPCSLRYSQPWKRSGVTATCAISAGRPLTRYYSPARMAQCD